MTGSDLLELYIEKCKAEGKTDDEIVREKFICDGSIYELKKSRRKGNFNFKIYCGAKDLREEYLSGRLK